MRSSGGSMRSASAAARWRTISSTRTARAASTGASSSAAARSSACRCRHDRLPGERLRLGRRRAAAGRPPSSDQQSQSGRRAARSPRRSTARRARSTRSRSPTTGGLAVLGQAGEYLVWSDSELNAVPRLAESWTPNDDASVWTFKIRQGVKFHDGTPHDGRGRRGDRSTGSRTRRTRPHALSAFTRRPDQGQREGDRRRRRSSSRSTRPNGNFPYLLSSDNYNTIILPADYDGRLREEHERHRPVEAREVHARARARRSARTPTTGTRSASRTRTTPRSASTAKEQARVLALQARRGRRRHAVLRLRRPSAADRPERQTSSSSRPSTHRQVHMRTDKEPFTDKRVRQALALAHRPQRRSSTACFKGKAQLGNDSPFAPVFPYTDTSVPQRQQDIEQAKQLLSEAGRPTASRSSWTPGTASRSPTWRS